MTRPLRMATPNQLYFVTNRTFQARLLITPSPYVNNLVGGVLGRALASFDVALHAFVFLSNHFHLIVSAPSGNISDFVGYIEANIAKEVGRHVGWRGGFWQRRFSAEPILDDNAFDQRLAYIFAHGVKEGLVDRAEDWPGLTSIPELCHSQRRVFPWYDRSAQYGARIRGEKSDESLFATWNPIVLTPTPAWASLSSDEQAQRAKHILAQAELSASEARGENPPSGRAAVMAQDPHSMPSVVKHSSRPLCHATTTAVRNSFRKLYREFAAAYRQASVLFRRGRIDVEFPAHSYRPPLPQTWHVMLPPLAAMGAG